MKKFVSECGIEPDEWTEPVFVFNKPIAAALSNDRQAKPRFRPNINIGVEDDAKMLPNPHSKFPPPQKPIH